MAGSELGASLDDPRRCGERPEAWLASQAEGGDGAATADLVARWDPGEDVGPLLRSVAASLVGLGGALALDSLVSNGPSWARLGSALVGTGLTGGVVTVSALALATALVFTYGQVRRFLVLPPLAVGVTWTLGLWIAAGPLLLARAHWLAPDPTAVMATLWAACLLVGETTAGVLWFGLVLGWLCRRLPAGPPPSGAQPRR